MRFLELNFEILQVVLVKKLNPREMQSLRNIINLKSAKVIKSQILIPKKFVFPKLYDVSYYVLPCNVSSLRLQEKLLGSLV